MSKTCETCRWWVVERDDSEHYVPRDLRDAGQMGVSDVFEIRLCGSPKLREYERPERDGAATVDGSHYMSCLATGPDFGCIHHGEAGVLDETERERSLRALLSGAIPTTPFSLVDDTDLREG